MIGDRDGLLLEERQGLDPARQGDWSAVDRDVGITVDRHKIELDEPLKSLGTYKVAIKVFSGMTPEVTIVVEPKG